MYDFFLAIAGFIILLLIGGVFLAPVFALIYGFYHNWTIHKSVNERLRSMKEQYQQNNEIEQQKSQERKELEQRPILENMSRKHQEIEFELDLGIDNCYEDEGKNKDLEIKVLKAELASKKEFIRKCEAKIVSLQEVMDKPQKVSENEAQSEKNFPIKFVKEAKFYKEDGDIIVSGTIKNISNKTISEITINYDLYDLDGNIIEDVSDNYYELLSGEEWAFEATSCYAEDVGSVSLKSIDLIFCFENDDVKISRDDNFDDDDDYDDEFDDEFDELLQYLDDDNILNCPLPGFPGSALQLR